MVRRLFAALGILAVMGVAIGMIGVLGPSAVDASGHSATRSFSTPTVAPGGELSVTVVAAGASQAVVETLPDGFSYVANSTTNGAGEVLVDGEGARPRGQTLGVVLVDAADFTFTYKVMASSVEGTHTFSGVVRDAARVDRAIGGQEAVVVRAGATTPPPSETPDMTTQPPADGPGATRSIAPKAVDGGGRVVVTISAADYGSFGVVTETLPDGFSYVAGTVVPSEITVEVDAQTVTFVLLGETSFRYTVTASSTPGQHTFSGNLSDDDNVEYDVGGDLHVTVNAATGPRAMRVVSPSSVNAGGVLSVTVTAADYGPFGVVAETLPEGFSYVTDSVRPSVITAEVAGQTASFVLLGETSFSYRVTASSALGDYEFSGNLSDDDNNEYPIGGDFEITVRAAPTPSTGGGGRRAPEPTRNRAPAFDEGGDASRSVAENSAGGIAVGEPISAKDRDNDKLAYQFRTAVDEFEIDKATGQISVAEGANLDFEAKRSYSVTVRVADPDDRTDNISVTINITDVDEEGIIEVSAEAPELGSELTVSLTDPDGTPMVVSWRWERSSDQVTWSAIDGAVSETYTASEADEGQYLRAIAMYTDVDGVEKESVKAFANPVPVAPAPTPDAYADTGTSDSGADPHAYTDTGTSDSGADPHAYADTGTSDAGADARAYADTGTSDPSADRYAGTSDPSADSYAGASDPSADSHTGACYADGHACNDHGGSGAGAHAGPDNATDRGAHCRSRGGRGGRVPTMGSHPHHRRGRAGSWWRGRLRGEDQDPKIATRTPR